MNDDQFKNIYSLTVPLNVASDDTKNHILIQVKSKKRPRPQLSYTNRAME